MFKLYEKMDLWPGSPQKATLQNFALENGENLPAFLILPGGGYQRCAKHEGAPIAAWLNSLGISAFVLEYSVAPSRYPQPLMDARRAMQFLRFHAEELRIDAQRLGVMGFSAGGHLAASLSNLYSEVNQDCDDELEKVSARPDLSVLCYPVISWGEFAHLGSKENLLGQQASEQLVAKTSMENAVHAKTPPSFIWHTVEDATVPVENAYLYGMALQKHKIRHELHVYPDGRHGLGLAKDLARSSNQASQWCQACEKFLYKEGF
ncbi:alpha/beta hydrolase [Lentisphaera profundi]|uniref:Alpha/beta hydrolase n=1 Tax=Lentisphaera profundi TaxID=1658616 RepID=A0ABY7VPW8_9BACT|nr:alpha/beta hydrolase [Lentisphaera profundi]WDE95290.1 alpha/beta hydrolase [Lentisphaera profundi]